VDVSLPELVIGDIFKVEDGSSDIKLEVAWVCEDGFSGFW
jgi:hypothetical protein